MIQIKAKGVQKERVDDLENTDKETI